MARIHVILPDGMVNGVDAARGDVSRSRWIMRAVEAALRAPEPAKSAATPARTNSASPRPSYVKPFNPAPKKGK